MGQTNFDPYTDRPPFPLSGVVDHHPSSTKKKTPPKKKPKKNQASASIALQFSGSDLAVVDLNGTGRSVLGQLTLNGFGAAGTPNAMFYVGGQPISLNLDVRLLFRGTISTLIYSGYP